MALEYRHLRRAVLLAAVLVIALWFLREAADVLMLAMLAAVLAIVFNAPVTWLEGRGLRRVWGCLIVFLAVVAVCGQLGWLVVPRVAAQGSQLADDLPSYVREARHRVAAWTRPYPAVHKNLPLDSGSLGDALPSPATVVEDTTAVATSVAAGVAGFLVLAAMVVYAVADPRPLLRLYLDLFPPAQRPRAARALGRASVMLVGWMWSNLVAGAIEAVLAGTALWLIGVPAALVWAAMALFAELVPKVGIYLMAVPPTLVALAVDPIKAVWVVLFYVALNEGMGNFVIPRIRRDAMDVHPVSVLLVMITMAAAFGLLGALVATPVAALAKAYFGEFYPPARRCPGGGEDRLVDAIVRRRPDEVSDGVIVAAEATE